MTSQDIIEKLKQESSEKYKANVIKMGIPEENSNRCSCITIKNNS